MNEIENEKALLLLRQTGCTSGEIVCFCQLQRDYAEQRRRVRRDQQRPTFARWLIELGKLLLPGTTTPPRAARKNCAVVSPGPKGCL